LQWFRVQGSGFMVQGNSIIPDNEIEDILIVCQKNRVL
jgi:hypothetical protein